MLLPKAKPKPREPRGIGNGVTRVFLWRVQKALSGEKSTAIAGDEARVPPGFSLAWRALKDFAAWAQTLLNGGTERGCHRTLGARVL